MNSLSFRAVYHFKIAEAVPLNENISYVELAKKTNLEATNLRRLVRHAMTNHIFKEPSPGYVAHTSSSRLLAEDAQLQAWVGFFSEDLLDTNCEHSRCNGRMAWKSRTERDWIPDCQ